VSPEATSAGSSGDDAVDGLDDELLEQDAHGLDSQVLVDDGVVVPELGGGRLMAHHALSMM